MPGRATRLGGEPLPGAVQGAAHLQNLLAPGPAVLRRAPAQHRRRQPHPRVVRDAGSEGGKTGPASDLAGQLWSRQHSSVF